MRDMICKKCGAKFEGNFCPKCGTPAEKELNVCPKCGQERGAGDRYCPKCGYDFARSDRKESVSFGAKAAEAVKKVPKKAWIAIVAIVLVVIVIIVLVSVLSNKFRLGVVEKIGIGDSRQSVIELLGEPYDYREGSSTFTYYSNNYLKLLEKTTVSTPTTSRIGATLRTPSTRRWSWSRNYRRKNTNTSKCDLMRKVMSQASHLINRVVNKQKMKANR